MLVTMKLKNKKAQVWVSVVIYTLIGLTAILLTLTVIQPRVKEFRDSITIKQTIEAFHEFDSALRSTLTAPGNKRNIEFKLSQGKLEILSIEDKVVWSFKSSNKFSEPNLEINEGNIKILTTKSENPSKKPWIVTLTLDYSELADITYENSQVKKTLGKSATSYIISIENVGHTVYPERRNRNVFQINLKVLT